MVAARREEDPAVTDHLPDHHTMNGNPNAKANGGASRTASALTTMVHRPEAYTAVVTVRGPLDLGTKDQLDGVLLAEVSAGMRHIVVDLAGVSFCDSSGLSTLLRVHRRLAEHSGWLRIASATGQVQRVLQLTNLDRILLRFPDTGSALAHQRGPA
jgi:anti-anti-sigma factor